MYANWLKINKVVAYKQKSESDELRQKAMGKQLVYLVRQTERYTNMIAENLQSGGEVGLVIETKCATSSSLPSYEKELKERRPYNVLAKLNLKAMTMARKKWSK